MSESELEVTDASAFQHRSLAKQVVFTVVTFGLYVVYWWYVTHRQLARGTDAESSPVLRTVGLFVPVVNLVVIWKTSRDAEAVTDLNGAVLFLLFLAVAPAGWYLVQSGVNAVASEQGD